MAGTRLLAHTSFVAAVLLWACGAWYYSATERAALWGALPLMPEENVVHLICAGILNIRRVRARGSSSNVEGHLIPDAVLEVQSLAQDVERLRESSTYSVASRLHFTICFIHEVDANPSVYPYAILPALLQELASFSRLCTVKSVVQVLQHVNLGNTRKVGPNAYELQMDQLSALLLSPTLRLSGHSPAYGEREITLYILIPAPDKTLHIVKGFQKHASDQNAVTGLLVPPSAACVVVNNGIGFTNRSTRQETELVRFMIHHVERLLGLESYETESQLGCKPETDRITLHNPSRCTDDKITVLKAAWMIDMYKTTASGLMELRSFADSTPNMPVTEAAAERYNSALVQVNVAARLLQQSNGTNVDEFEGAIEAITLAYQLTQTVHFDPTMLPIVFMQWDQIFAVYGPLWLPLLAPLLLDTVNEVRRYRSKTSLSQSLSREKLQSYTRFAYE